MEVELMLYGENMEPGKLCGRAGGVRKGRHGGNIKRKEEWVRKGECE